MRRSRQRFKKEGDFQRRYPRTPSQAIDRVFSLDNLNAQVFDKYGRIQKVQLGPRCEEISYL